MAQRLARRYGSTKRRWAGSASSPPSWPPTSCGMRGGGEMLLQVLEMTAPHADRIARDRSRPRHARCRRAACGTVIRPPAPPDRAGRGDATLEHLRSVLGARAGHGRAVADRPRIRCDGRRRSFRHRRAGVRRHLRRHCGRDRMRRYAGASPNAGVTVGHAWWQTDSDTDRWRRRPHARRRRLSASGPSMSRRRPCSDMHRALSRQPRRRGCLRAADSPRTQAVTMRASAISAATVVAARARRRAWSRTTAPWACSCCAAQQFDYAWPADSRVVMHSDGLSARWRSRATTRACSTHHAAVIAARAVSRLMRRARDDATVLVRDVIGH